MHNQPRGAFVRLRTNRDGTRRWQACWRERGREIAKGFKTELEAEQFVKKIKIVRDIQSVMAVSLTEPGKLTNLIPTYVELVRAKNKPGSSHADQVQYVLVRDTARIGLTWTTDIDTNAFDSLVRLYGEHRATLKKAISMFKSFLRWARRSRHAIDEWVLEYQAPKHIPEERIAWNDDQVQRLLAECDKPNLALSLPSGEGAGRGSQAMVDRMVATRDYLIRRVLRPALWLMLRYAPRPMEVTKLTVGNWNSTTRTLHLPGKITKNRHPREFKVDAETARMLDEVAGDRPAKDPLFLNAKKRPYTSHHLTDLINVLITRARLPGTAYCCRHTATTRLIHFAKGDLPVVQAITGHRTLSELQRYLHATTDRRDVVSDAYDEEAVKASQKPLRHLRIVE